MRAADRLFVTIKQVKVLVNFLSYVCMRAGSQVLFLGWLLVTLTLCCCHSKSIIVTHIKATRVLGRFDDLLILAAKHVGQNASAVFWLGYCHMMPQRGYIMGGQV